MTRNVAETSSSPSSSYLSPSIEPHPVVPGLTTDFVRFYNVAPRTRKVRRAQLDKETLEKQRLKDRTGGYHTYDEFQRVVGYESGTPGFQTEAQRFDRDSAGEEQRLRKSRLQRQNLILEKRREENRQREERRIRLEEEKRTAEKERWRALQNDPMAGKKNVGSTPYDQITLRYNDGKDGQRLKYQDSLVKWRAAHRARRLQEKAMGGNANPITGQPQRLIEVPKRPVPP